MRAGTLLYCIPVAPRTVSGMEEVKNYLMSEWMAWTLAFSTPVFSKLVAVASLLAHLLPWNHLTNFQNCSKIPWLVIKYLEVMTPFPSLYFGSIAPEEAQGLSYKALLISTLTPWWPLHWWVGRGPIICYVNCGTLGTHLYQTWKYSLPNLYYLAKIIKNNNNFR